MTRSPLRNLLPEAATLLGIGFGVWLIHNAFQPGSDVPSVPLVLLGALVILLCFFLLGKRLRKELREGVPLPGRWIVGGVVLAASFLGWIAALFLDSQRLQAEELQHREYNQQLAKLEDSVRHMGDAMANAAVLDRHAWDVNHDLYARLHDQLQVILRPRATWSQDLTRIDEQVRLMQKAYNGLPVESVVQQRLKLAGDFQLARDRAVTITETLRTDIAKSADDVVAHRRSRWQAVGASALTGVIFLLSSLILLLGFDRELRRSWKARTRLTESESRYRSLIENAAEPLALLDASAAIVYANRAWEPVFGREPEQLLGAPLLEMIHPDDRARVLSALQSRIATAPIACRLGVDYGVWNDVEMHCQIHAEENVLVARFRNVRETPEFTAAAPVEAPKDTASLQKLQEAEAQIAELERRCETLRTSEQAARSELDHQRWLLGSVKDAGGDGLLILSTQGQVLSWNPAFAQLWKLSAETLSAHSWLTIAAHMETLAQSGWDDFRAHSPSPLAGEGRGEGKLRTDSCWEMTLEDGKLLEVYSQVLRDHPGNAAAVRFHFRDVTRQRELESHVRSHDERKQATEKRVKQLEKQLHERERRHEEMEAALLEHQDRLHQMHKTHEDHTRTAQSSSQAMRRLAGGVANEINTILSVVLGNTDVLHDNLPPDHVAQNYLGEIREAAGKGTDLAQRLLGLSGKQFTQAAPVEMNDQLESAESKIRAALGQARLQWERGPKELWVKADSRSLEQTLVTLATHGRGAGTVTIKTSRTKLTQAELTHDDMAAGPYICVEVCDTGAVLDDETLPHIFEPYLPLGDGHKGDLSLASAYNAMRQSGGSIRVTSAAGQGTTWTLLLPETTERGHSMRASA